MRFVLIVLTFLYSAALLAQDHYEYATYQRMNTGRSLVFTTREKTEEVTDPAKEEEIKQHILQKLTDLSKEGWEVYHVVLVVWPVYFLRRKIQ